MNKTKEELTDLEERRIGFCREVADEICKIADKYRLLECGDYVGGEMIYEIDHPCDPEEYFFAMLAEHTDWYSPEQAIRVRTDSDGKEWRLIRLNEWVEDGPKYRIGDKLFATEEEALEFFEATTTGDK